MSTRTSTRPRPSGCNWMSKWVVRPCSFRDICVARLATVSGVAETRALSRAVAGASEVSAVGAWVARSGVSRLVSEWCASGAVSTAISGGAGAAAFGSAAWAAGGVPWTRAKALGAASGAALWFDLPAAAGFAASVFSAFTSPRRLRSAGSDIVAPACVAAVAVAEAAPACGAAAAVSVAGT